MAHVGYIQYVVVLFLLTGFLVLRFDVKGYELKQRSKEKKTARFIGWLNVSLGVMTFLGNWAYQRWFW